MTEDRIRRDQDDLDLDDDLAQDDGGLAELSEADEDDDFEPDEED